MAIDEEEKSVTRSEAIDACRTAIKRLEDVGDVLENAQVLASYRATHDKQKETIEKLQNQTAALQAAALRGEQVVAEQRTSLAVYEEQARRVATECAELRKRLASEGHGLICGEQIMAEQRDTIESLRAETDRAAAIRDACHRAAEDECIPDGAPIVKVPELLLAEVERLRAMVNERREEREAYAHALHLAECQYEKAIMAFLTYVEACAEGLPGLDDRLSAALLAVNALPQHERGLQIARKVEAKAKAKPWPEGAKTCARCNGRGTFTRFLTGTEKCNVCDGHGYQFAPWDGAPEGLKLFADVALSGASYGKIIRVQESSAAEQACVWLFLIAPGGRASSDSSAHLTAEEATQLVGALAAFLGKAVRS